MISCDPDLAAAISNGWLPTNLVVDLRFSKRGFQFQIADSTILRIHNSGIKSILLQSYFELLPIQGHITDSTFLVLCDPHILI